MTQIYTPLNTISKSKIISVAHSWLNTPFHYHARVKGEGCDCVGLIIGVALELGALSQSSALLQEYDSIAYSHDNQEDFCLLLETFDKYFTRIGQPDSGNIIVLQSDHNTGHLGILYDHNNQQRIIHACMISGKVTQHRFSESWKRRVMFGYALHTR